MLNLPTLGNSANLLSRIILQIFVPLLTAVFFSGCLHLPVEENNHLLTENPTAIAETSNTSINQALPLDEALPLYKALVLSEAVHLDEALALKQAIPRDTTLPPPIITDTWQRIRNGFAFPDRQHKRITQEFNWFKRHPEYIKRVVERAKPYLHYIIERVEAADIPAEIALLPIVESAFQPFAYSHGRAAGIWQFIPTTGKRYGLKQNWWYDGRRDVYESTKAAIKLLKKLNQNFKGDWMHALAAYNTGDARVKRAIRRNKRLGKSTDFFSLNLPKETRAYVPKLLALKKLINNAEENNIQIDIIPNEPYFEQVKLDSQIDLALAADLAGLPLDDLYRLNSGYNRWATAPNGPHDLLLPVTHVEQFKNKFAELPAEKRILWIRHRVKNGETLSSIAQKYHTSIPTIKRVNRLRGRTIRAGRGLTIPVASLALVEYKLSANQRRSKLQNIPREGRKVSYIVQQGDTFWDLAQYHRIGVKQLAKWNSMAPRDRLQAGQHLIIWSRRGKSLSSVDIEKLSAPPRRSITKRIGYRVRNGDSLARISNKFRVSIKQLKRWNRSVRTKKYLQPGQWLTLIVDVARQSG